MSDDGDQLVKPCQECGAGTWSPCRNEQGQRVKVHASRRGHD